MVLTVIIFRTLRIGIREPPTGPRPGAAFG